MLGICLAAYGLLRVLARRERPSPGWVARAAILWGVLCGIGAAHHLTAVFVAGPLSIVLAIAPNRRYLLRRVEEGRWSHPFPPEYRFRATRSSRIGRSTRGVSMAGDRGVVRERWQHMSAARYQGLLGVWAPSAASLIVIRSYAYPALALGVPALAWAVARARGADRLMIAGLLAIAVVNTIYSFNYGVTDPDSYFLPAIAAAMLAPAPLAGLLAARRGVFVATATAVAIALCILYASWIRTGFELRQALIVVEARVHALWESIPVERGIVLWPDDMSVVLKAYQILDGERRGLDVENPALLAWHGPLESFRTRFGFDPLEGLRPLSTESSPLIPQNMNRQTRIPVIVFDRDRDTVIV